MDDIEIQVEVSEEVFSDEMARLETLQRKVSDEIESVLGIRARVKLVEPRTIERSAGKAKRVIDKREI
jgi:phenylacetate-CoA ligase